MVMMKKEITTARPKTDLLTGYLRLCEICVDNKDNGWHHPRGDEHKQ